jgi:hypothetical protein
MSRRLRILASVFALLSFVAAQAALSSYGCPTDPHMMMNARAMDASGDNAQSIALCQQHCRDALSGVESAKAEVAIAASAAWLRVVARDPAAIAAKKLWQSAPLPPQPPPAIRFAVLRI